MKKRIGIIVLFAMLLQAVAALAATAAEEQASVNLAHGKPVQAYAPDNTITGIQPVSELPYAVDGNLNTWLEAYGTYAWKLEVDLEAVHAIDRVLVHMTPVNYSTHFELQVSSGGNSPKEFVTIAEAKGFDGTLGKPYQFNFDVTKARYIRINSLKPDGADQTGRAMAVSHLEVYGPAAEASSSDTDTDVDEAAEDSIAAKHEFTDMNQAEWAREIVKELSSRGIVSGTGEGTFSPMDPITRADYIVLLMNTLGTVIPFESQFADVQQGVYYYNHVGGAKALGLISGFGDNLFKPKSFIKRQDMMVITAQAFALAGMIELDETPTATVKKREVMISASMDKVEEILSSFTDADQISGYARKYVAALVQAGIIKGNGNKLNPQLNLTRAEAASTVYQFLNASVRAGDVSGTEQEEKEEQQEGSGLNSGLGTNTGPMPGPGTAPNPTPNPTPPPGSTPSPGPTPDPGDETYEVVQTNILSIAALYMDGTNADLQPYSQLEYAIDGDNNTIVQAYGQYLWQLEADLGAVKRLDHMNVRMDPEHYATHFRIQVAGADKQFRTVHSASGFDGQSTYTHEFNNDSGRYIRIAAIKPDGGSQPGDQMAIAEMEVYVKQAVNPKTTVMPKPANGSINRPYVIDASNLEPWEQFAVSAFQGLANRQQGRVFVTWNSGDEFWLEQYQQMNAIVNNPVMAAFNDLPMLVKNAFSEHIDGLLVYDESVFTDESETLLINVLTAIAAEEKLIPVPASYAAAMQLPIRFDATNRWSSMDEAYAWVIDEYPDLVAPGPLAHYHPTVLNVRDYLVAHKILPLFYWSGMSSETKQLFDDVLLSTGPNQPLIGVWNIPSTDPRYEHLNHPPGVGNEHTFLKLISPYAKYLIVVGEPGLANISYTSGMNVNIPDWRKGMQEEQPVLDRTKKYVSLLFSDGDNLGFVAPGDVGMPSTRWWNHAERGDVAISWTISPLLQDVLPGVMRYYYDSATEKDSFTASLSGAGYMLLDYYGTQYLNRDQLLRDYFTLTGELMQQVGLKSLHVLPEYFLKQAISPSEYTQLALIADTMGDTLESLYLDYGRREVDYDEMHKVISGKPVFLSVTASGESVESMASRIQASAPSTGPVFMNAFIENWSNSPGTLVQLAELLGPNYVIVSADQLAELYMQSLE